MTLGSNTDLQTNKTIGVTWLEIVDIWMGQTEDWRERKEMGNVALLISTALSFHTPIFGILRQWRDFIYRPKIPPLLEIKIVATRNLFEHCKICNPHVVLLARISLTLSRHFSLSFIASCRSSGLHPVSTYSCCMYVRDGRPAFVWPYAGVHRSTSLISSSLLLQQCPVCLVRLASIVFVMGAGGRIVGALWGVAARTCSVLLATFLCNCRLASPSAV